MIELKKSEKYLAALKAQNKEIEDKNRLLEKSNSELIKAKEKAEELNRLLPEEKQKLQKLSITDYLTGTYNKEFITSHLDVVGRYGGDEFLIILPDTNKEEGCAVMECVCQKVMELKWDNDLVVTISGGVIEIEKEMERETQKETEKDKTTGLLKKLDQLLYSAKYKGKNLIEYKENAG